MPRVNIRRHRSRQPSSLTAASQRVTPRSYSSFRSAASSGNGWQEDAWVYLEKVGELQYFVSWRAWAASRCCLVASALDDQGLPLGSIPDDDPNAETVRRIVSDIAGGASQQSSFIQRAGYLITTVGECWAGVIVRDASREKGPAGGPSLVDVDRPGFQREQWYVFGADQISSGPQGIELKLPDGTVHQYTPDSDVLFRVWSQHPKDPTKPISPIWSTRVVLHAIVQADATIKAANNSRLVGNGIMFVPQEMSLPQQDAPGAVPVGSPDLPDPAPFVEPSSAQQLQDLLFDVASTAKRDPESQAAMLPLIAAVPGEMIKNVNWIRPGSDIPETTLKIQEHDLVRLARGLEVEPERLLGRSGSNHWTAWAMDDNDVRIHVVPLVELIASALTTEVLRYSLTAEGIDPSQYVIWYDTTALTQDPDKTDEAREAFDRGALTAAALREHLGFDAEDGYDLTTPDGWVALALDKIAADPANAAVFMPIIEAAAARVGLEIAAPAALPAGIGGRPEDISEPDSEPPEPESAPEAPEPPLTAAMTVARLCVNRALELANKRRRTRADSALLRDVPIELAHTRMDPAPLSETSTLMRGWATGVNDTDLCDIGVDPAVFRSTVEAVTALALVSSSAPVLTPAMLRRIL